MNRIVRALAALALSSWPAVAAAQYQATVLADAPVAYYRFEEAAGTSALDSSGNGNTGTYTNGPLLARASLPQLGLAVSFDGINDHVVTPRTVATDFTLELWLRTTATSPAGAQAFQGDGLLWSDVGGSANDFVLAVLNDRAAFFTGNPDTTVIGTTLLNDGSWHHVVVRRTMGSAKQLYVDGVLQATGTTSDSAAQRAGADRDRGQHSRLALLRRPDRRGGLLHHLVVARADPGALRGGNRILRLYACSGARSSPRVRRRREARAGRCAAGGRAARTTPARMTRRRSFPGWRKIDG